MTIKINAKKDEGEGRIKLHFPVPLVLLNLGFVWNHLPPEQKQYKPIAKELVRALKEYKRQNGSWDLVNVQTAEGDEVRIRI